MNDLKVLENSVFAKHVKLTKTGLTISEGISYKEWEHIGSVLQQMGEAVHWWLGDWLKYGEKNWGDEGQKKENYTQAINETGFSYNTLRNDAYICDRIDSARRRANLSFSLHSEVAKLEPDEQDIWLAKAEKEEMTTQDIRQAIRDKKVRDDRSEAISDLDLRRGDFKKALADLKNIDTIITNHHIRKSLYNAIPTYRSMPANTLKMAVFSRLIPASLICRKLSTDYPNILLMYGLSVYITWVRSSW